MARFRISNRSSSSSVVLPISPSLVLVKGETRTVDIPAAQMEVESIKALERAGLLSIVPMNDPTTDDGIEVSVGSPQSSFDPAGS